MNEETESTVAGEPLVSESHPELFHYTNLRALEGMLESGTLWATHARHLNDSSEFDLMWDKITPHVTKYFLNAAQSDPSRFSDHQATIDSFGGLEDVAAHDANMLVQTMKSTMSKYSEPYVACFTSHEQNYDRRNGLLSQWRGYGNDGVAIVLDTKELEKQLEVEYARFRFSGCSVADAVYYERMLDLEEQFPRLFGALDDVARAFVNGSIEESQPHESFEKIAKELLPTVGRLKHWGFREEKECRIIVGVSEPRHFRDVARSIIDSLEFKEICSRPGRYGSIPYIRLFEGSGNLPILRVLVGPSRDQDANVTKVAAMLQELAPGRGIVLERSAIPYVSTA